MSGGEPVSPVARPSGRLPRRLRVPASDRDFAPDLLSAQVLKIYGYPVPGGLGVVVMTVVIPWSRVLWRF